MIDHSGFQALMALGALAASPLFLAQCNAEQIPWALHCVPASLGGHCLLPPAVEAWFCVSHSWRSPSFLPEHLADSFGGAALLLCDCRVATLADFQLAGR